MPNNISVLLHPAQGPVMAIQEAQCLTNPIDKWGLSHLDHPKAVPRVFPMDTHEFPPTLIGSCFTISLLGIGTDIHLRSRTNMFFWAIFELSRINEEIASEECRGCDMFAIFRGCEKARDFVVSFAKRLFGGEPSL